MAIKDMQEIDNILLRRKELYFTMFHLGEPTPTRQAIRNKIAAQYAVDLDLVFVYKMVPEFGRGSTKCEVYIYESKEAADLLVPKHIKLRNKVNDKEGEKNT